MNLPEHQPSKHICHKWTITNQSIIQNSDSCYSDKIFPIVPKKKEKHTRLLFGGQNLWHSFGSFLLWHSFASFLLLYHSFQRSILHFFQFFICYSFQRSILHFFQFFI